MELLYLQPVLWKKEAGLCPQKIIHEFSIIIIVVLPYFSAHLSTVCYCPVFVNWPLLYCMQSMH